MGECEKMPAWMLEDHSEEYLRKLYDVAKFVKEDMSFESFLEQWAYQRTQAVIIAKNLKNFYVTFECDGKKSNHFVLIHAPNLEIARTSMIKKYGFEWCTSYSEEMWNSPEFAIHLKHYQKFDEWTVIE